MAITNLNPQIWNRIFNGDAIKSDLRQTGITKNTGPLLGKNIFCEFFFVTCQFLCKKNYIPTSCGFSMIPLQIYREILQKYRNRAITLFKILLFQNIRRSKKQLCTKGNPNRFRNGREKREQTDRKTDRQTNMLFCIYISRD